MAAAPRIQLHPSTPWGLGIFDRLRLPAFWVGVGIALSVFAVYLVYTGLFGPGVGYLEGTRGGEVPWAWLAELIQDFFIGFTLALSAASIRGARRDFADLMPHLDAAEDDLPRLERAMLSYSRGPLVALAFVGGAATGLLTITDPSLWQDGVIPGWSDPSALWLIARNFVNWYVVVRAMGLELMLGRTFSRLGERVRLPDLLDREPLAAFGRRALRNVLLWMLLAAFLSLTYLGEGWASDLMVLALVWLLAFALAAFVLPLTGIRRRVRERKHDELGRVRAVLAEARGPALAGAEGVAPGRLADLLAWEARVEAVHEWPIDAPMLLRLALYLAIGLGSWVGAAFVERALETALG
jgi:hypothetical protein